MIPSFRTDFNHRYRPDLYRKLLTSLDAAVGTHIQFRVAETPCFFPAELMDRIATIGADLTARLVDDNAYLRASRSAIPEAYRVPDETSHPHFMTADFGLVRTSGGQLEPRLVELQAFPSIFAYQSVLAEAYRETFHLDQSLDPFLGGHTETSFWKLYSQVVLGGHDPENVILSEIDPLHQKTFPDFLITAERLGISSRRVRQLAAAGELEGTIEHGAWRIWASSVDDYAEKRSA